MKKSKKKNNTRLLCAVRGYHKWGKVIYPAKGKGDKINIVCVVCEMGIHIEPVLKKWQGFDGLRVSFGKLDW